MNSYEVVKKDNEKDIKWLLDAGDDVHVTMNKNFLHNVEKGNLENTSMEKER